MAQQKAEVERIANNPAAPNFDNTVVAMERSGLLFERTNLAFQAVNGANTDDVLQATDTKASPLWAPEYPGQTTSSSIRSFSSASRRCTTIKAD